MLSIFSTAKLFNIHFNSVQDVEGGVTLSQPASRKNPPKNNPTITKTQFNHIKGIKEAQKHQVQVLKEIAPLSPTGLLPKIIP